MWRNTKNIIGFLIGLISYCSAATVLASDEDIYPVVGPNQYYFLHDQFKELDSEIDMLAEKGTQNETGRWWLEGATLAFQWQFEIDTANNFKAHLSRFEKWKVRNPKSVGAAVGESILWVQYAQAARGKGYASSVTKEGWQLYGTRLKKAKELLDQSKSYASSNPIWYNQYMVVALLSKTTQTDRLNILKEATLKTKLYTPFYQVTSVGLLPKWGGSYEDIEKFAQWAAEYTKAEMGYSMYANIYKTVDDNSRADRENIFETSKISWAMAKKGFEEISTRYPAQPNINRYASFACRAKDKVTYLKIRPKIKKIDEDSWSDNISMDVCDVRFSYKP